MKHFINIEICDINIDIDKKVFNKTFNCDIEMLRCEVEEWRRMVDKNDYFRVCYDEYKEFIVLDIDGNQLEFRF